MWTLQFNLVFNTGAAFSQGRSLGPYIGVAAAVVVVILLWSGRSVPNRLGAVAMGAVLGGALGNLVDRAFRRGDGFLGGAVVDFIDFQWFPVFNVADIGVVGGAILLMLATLLDERRSLAEAAASERSERSEVTDGTDTADTADTAETADTDTDGEG